ncbi:MAG TPA: glycerophosphodiester phosphodiesterase family protein [Pirellulales bacterium]|nr:glycerophosphodiester phosphodiesterase family protein [Pirellulales bacterium]
MATLSLIDVPKTLVLAHRGNSRAAPENTLPAFESALQLGVDLVELDYHHTADGVPVVFHDEELDRCTDACYVWGGTQHLLAQRTFAELQQLDAGGWFGQAFRGTHIATLEDALKLICARAGCMIERKSGDAATCVSLLRRLNVVERCVVTAFDWLFLAECHRLAPELLLGALGTDPLTPERLSEAQQTGARVIGWDNDIVTAEHVRLVHSHRLKAWVWTVDEPARAAELVSWGIDGLISNLPGDIQAVAADASR